MAEDKGGCLGLFSRESSKCAVRLIVKQRLIINCVRQPCHGSPNNQVGPNALGWVTKTQPSKIAMPSHIYRAFANIPLSTIEISGSQMVLAMKLITFAWNVEDGRHKHEVTSWQLLPFLSACLMRTLAFPLQELDRAQDGTRVAQLPSLLSFLGYWCVPFEH